MSATKTVGGYEIGSTPLWDSDLERWYIRLGVQTTKGLDLHYTVHSKSPGELLMRADRLARLLTKPQK